MRLERALSLRAEEMIQTDRKTNDKIPMENHDGIIRQNLKYTYENTCS